MSAFGWLALAILSEVVATSALKAAEGFTRPAPSIAVGVGYPIAFYCLSHALKTVPIGVAYAIWSGVGILLVTLMAWIVYRQRLDALSLFAIGMILVGAIILQVRAH